MEDLAGWLTWYVVAAGRDYSSARQRGEPASGRLRIELTDDDLCVASRRVDGPA